MSGSLTFISAGAGSGKTYRLTELLCEHLRDERHHPAGVIATTFTRKAAAELRERVRGHVLENEGLGTAVALDQALIGTVNGISQSLLQRFCFEAGLSPDLRLIEELDGDILMRECLDDVVTEDTQATLNAVASRMGIENWQGDVQSIVTQARSNHIEPERFAEIAQRNADELLCHFGSASTTNLDDALKQVIDRKLPELKTAAQGSTKRNTATCIERFEEIRRQLESGTYNWSAWASLTEAMPEKSLASYVEAVHDCASRYLSHPRLHQDVRDYITGCFVVAGRVLERYQERKRELGAIDFTDQEVLLLNILDHPLVADAIREELELLLVDEFQDTSPIQLALFMKLTQLANKTIWVGDLKQAIYGFRGSDASLMNAVISALPKLGGRTEVLDRSWRSRPALVHLVNQVFVTAFDSIPRAHVELTPQRSESSTETAYEVWKLDGKKIENRLEALAHQIHALLQSGRQVVDKTTNALRPLKPGDIAILCRSNARVAQVVERLLDAGVPFATAHAGLLSQPECVLALACLRRLNDDGDTIASAEIVALGDCQKPEQWLSDRLDYLGSGGKPREWKESGADAHSVLATIAQLRGELPLLSPLEAIQRVLGSCDLSRRVLQWCKTDVEARQRLANLDALIDLAATYEEGCRSTGAPGSIAGLILWLDKLADEATDNQPVVSADAVHVLTHHAAKGLEWPAVILLDLESPLRDRYWGISAESTGSLDVQAPLENRFIRFRPWPFGRKVKVPVRQVAAASPAGKAAIDSAMEEERRLLYVSMTRARDLMILALEKLEWNAGSWLGVSQSPWLVDLAKLGDLALPAQPQIPSAARNATVTDEKTTRPEASATLHWFEDPACPETRLPLYVHPSSADPISCSVSPAIPIGKPVPITHGFDLAIVGTAIHAVIAAGLGPSGPLSSEAVDKLLNRFHVRGSVDPHRLCAFLTSLRTWISTQWPRASVMPEMPVSVRRFNGQIAKGQIDLLIEQAHGRVIIDYKTALENVTPEREEILHYAGQLTAYAELTNTLRPTETIQKLLVLTAKGEAVELLDPAD